MGCYAQIEYAIPLRMRKDLSGMGLVCGCPHYLFAAGYGLLWWFGILVVSLPLGLYVVRRFYLSGQAKYFFIPFKDTREKRKKIKKKKKTMYK